MFHFGPGISRRLWTIWHHQVQNYRGQPSRRVAWRVEEKVTSWLVTSTVLAPAMSKGTSTDRLQADDLAVVEIPAFKALGFASTKHTSNYQVSLKYLHLFGSPASPKEVCLPSSLKADELVKYNTSYYSNVNWSHLLKRNKFDSWWQVIPSSPSASYAWSWAPKLGPATFDFDTFGVLVRLSRKKEKLSVSIHLPCPHLLSQTAHSNLPEFQMPKSRKGCSALNGTESCKLTFEPKKTGNFSSLHLLAFKFLAFQLKALQLVSSKAPVLPARKRWNSGVVIF